MRAEDQQAIVLNIAFYAVVGALGYFFLRYVLSWTAPFFLGVSVAALMRPAAMRLVKKWHWRERAAATSTIALFYLGAAGAVTIFLTIVLAQAYELLIRLPELYSDSIAPLIERFGGWFYGLAARFNPDTGSGLERFSEAVSDAIRQAAVDGSSHLVGWAAGLAAKLPILLLSTIFTVMISLLAATNYRAVGTFLYRLVPERIKPRARGLQTFLHDTVCQLLRAYTIIMAITFAQLAAGLWLLGFEYVLPVAACITLLDLLPIIGSGTVLVPWGLVLLASGDYAGGGGLLILFGIILVVRNIVEPRIVGSRIGLHPIATITAMYAGLKIAGFVGLILAPVLVLLGRFLWTSGESG